MTLNEREFIITLMEELSVVGGTMVNYYQYLWKTTWIEALGILVLGLFILIQYTWKVYAKAQNPLRPLDKWMLAFKGIGWLLIFGTYLLIFNTSEPDWFAKPVQVQGEIQGKSMVSNSLYPYNVEIEWDSGREVFHLDPYTYQELKTGQRVNVTFLPHRMQVISCEILPPDEDENEKKLLNPVKRMEGDYDI